MLDPQRHRMKAVNRVLERDARRTAVRRPLLRAGMRDDLEQQPIVVLERDEAFGKDSSAALRRAFELHSVTNESLHPEAEGARLYGERRHRHLAGADAATACAGPRKERHDASRRPRP